MGFCCSEATSVASGAAEERGPREDVGPIRCVHFFFLVLYEVAYMGLFTFLVNRMFFQD